MSDTGRDDAPRSRPSYKKRGMNLDLLLGGRPAAAEEGEPTPTPPQPAQTEPAEGGEGRGARDGALGASAQPLASVGTAVKSKGVAKTPRAKRAHVKASSEGPARTDEAGSGGAKVRISLFVTEAERDALRILAIENGYGNGVSAYVVDALGLATRR